MARIRTSVSAAALGLMLLPVSSAADPIRAVFAIDVFSVSTNPDQSVEPEPFSAQFRLPVTFDGRVRFLNEFGCCGAAQFGDPTFGDIPLPHLGIPPGIRPFDNHGTFGFWTRLEDGSFSRGFTLATDLTFDPSVDGFGGNGFYLQVFGERTGLETQPSLDPHDLLSIIRPQEFPTFIFFTSRRFSNDEVQVFSYLGHATFLSSEAAPIPEPTSLVLLGTGVLGAILRKRFLGTGN